MSQHKEYLMSILDMVIKQVQQQNTQLVNSIKIDRGNPLIPLFVQPINRSTVNNVYNIINSPQFQKERQSFQNSNNLDVIIDSGGGDADAAYHIAKLLHKNFSGEITYIIPRFAKSAATLLVCGGNKIIMGPTSELGPLDPQILQQNKQRISAKSVQSTLNLIKEYVDKGSENDLKMATIVASRLEPLILGEYTSTLQIAKEYQKELLFLRMFKKTKANMSKVDKIVEKFAEGYTHHSRIIDYEETKQLGLKVKFWGADRWSPIWNLYMSHTQIIFLIKVMKILEKAKEGEIE